MTCVGLLGLGDLGVQHASPKASPCLTPVSSYYPNKLPPQDRATHDHTPLLCSPCCFAARRGPARACASRPTWPRGWRHRRAAPAPLAVLCCVDHKGMRLLHRARVQVEIRAADSGQVSLASKDFPHGQVPVVVCTPAAVATSPSTFTNPLPCVQVPRFCRLLHSTG